MNDFQNDDALARRLYVYKVEKGVSRSYMPLHPSCLAAQSDTYCGCVPDDTICLQPLFCAALYLLCALLSVNLANARLSTLYVWVYFCTTV